MSSPTPSSRGRGRGRGRELTPSERVANWVNQREAKRISKERWANRESGSNSPAEEGLYENSIQASAIKQDSAEMETNSEKSKAKRSKVQLYVPPSLRGKSPTEQPEIDKEQQNNSCFYQESELSTIQDVSEKQNMLESSSRQKSAESVNDVASALDTPRPKGRGRGRRKPEVEIYVPRALRAARQAEQTTSSTSVEENNKFKQFSPDSSDSRREKNSSLHSSPDLPEATSSEPVTDQHQTHSDDVNKSTFTKISISKDSSHKNKLKSGETARNYMEAGELTPYLSSTANSFPPMTKVDVDVKDESNHTDSLEPTPQSVDSEISITTGNDNVHAGGDSNPYTFEFYDPAVIAFLPSPPIVPAQCDAKMSAFFAHNPPQSCQNNNSDVLASPQHGVTGPEPSKQTTAILEESRNDTIMMCPESDTLETEQNIELHEEKHVCLSNVNSGMEEETLKSIEFEDVDSKCMSSDSSVSEKLHTDPGNEVLCNNEPVPQIENINNSSTKSKHPKKPIKSISTAAEEPSKKQASKTLSEPPVSTGNEGDTLVESKPKKGTTTDAEGGEEDESWDALFDDNGDCLDDSMVQELTEYVGKVEIDKPKINYLKYEPKEPDLDLQAFGHIVEIYDFSPELATCDIISAFRDFASRGFDVKWVDDTHALGIFSSTVAANEALRMVHPLLKVRPMSEASKKGQSKARHCQEFLQPYKARPETTSMAARRLVAGALGMAPRVSREVREQERQKLKEAKEKRRQERQQKVDMWDGTVGKCAMDDGS